MSARFRWLARALLLGAALAGSASSAGCGDRKDDGTAPSAVGELPPLAFGESMPNLMLTWIDDRGATHVEVAPKDVPLDARSFVRVLVADREEGTRDPIYVADLGGSRTTYEAKSLPRSTWEREIEKRRAAWLAEAAPPPAPVPPGDPASPPGPHGGPASPPSPGGSVSPLPAGVTVVIYGADWCKPCHQAADFLRARGVPTVVKDVDKSPEAQSEMQQKLEKAGKRGGSIPVIDVAGQVLVGFDPRALERALSSARGGTLL